MDSMADIFDISGRTALITGSSRGIGRALAAGLAAAGARVVIHGRDLSVAKATAREIAKSHGSEVLACGFDVTDSAQIVAGVERIRDQFGELDILVNNAGMQRRAPLLDFTAGDWEQLVATNLSSAFFVAQEVARSMAERGTGKIVNIGSVQSSLGRPGITPYAVTKGGIVMLTRGMCADLAPLGIQVNCLAPGYFATNLTRALVDDAEFTRWLAARTPAGRWGRVDELIGTLRFLVSEASDFVNGQVIYVDGGMTAVV